MDKERIRELAESAQERGNTAHARAMGSEEDSQEYHGFLNDAFYWFGHANAYKGIMMLMESETV